MQLNVVFIATALLATASLAMSAIVIAGFAGADCTGTRSVLTGIPALPATGICFFSVAASGGSFKSIGYSGVPNSIAFFLSDGGHDMCTNGADQTLQVGATGGSGCENAPIG
jgi:hypothetical protein